MSTALMATLLAAATFLIFWYVRIRLNEKAQRFEETKNAAWISLQAGSGKLASWIRDEGKLSDFLFVVQKLALRKGVPHRRILEALATEHFFVQLISFAGALEFRNATFTEQQLAVAETIVQRFAYDERMRAEAEIFFSDCDETQSADFAEAE